MKKIIAPILIMFSIVILAGCSGVKAEGHTAATFLYEIEGSSNKGTIYWKSEADGVSTVKTKNGQYVIGDLPRRIESYDVTVADNEDFKNPTIINVPKISPLGDAADFWRVYENIQATALDHRITLPDEIQEGKNEVKEHGITFTVYVNDGKITGISAFELLRDTDEESAAILSETIIATALMFDGDASKVADIIVKATKEENEKDGITATTGKVTIQSVAMADNYLGFNLYKK